MNIFYLHKDPKICAEMHLDKHCTKMLIEYAQLMSTAHRVLDGIKYTGKSKTGRKVTRYKLENNNEENTVYKACHINHPSNVWARDNTYNYNWLYQMWSCLHEEFKVRYGKDHKSYVVLKDLLRDPPKNIPLNIPFHQPTQAMPDDVKNKDSITAYRNYYIKYKNSFATWKTNIPKWYSEGINANI
jgi:hypothetical protein